MINAVIKERAANLKIRSPLLTVIKVVTCY